MNSISKPLFFILFFSGFIIHAQDNIHDDNESHFDMKGASRLSLGLGHTYVSQGEKEGDTKWLVVPSWSIDYDYWLTEKWAIGLQNEIILETFVIETNDKELFERNHPITIIPVGLYKPVEHLTLIGGFGAEFSENDNFATTRLGLEYGFHLPKQWEVSATAIWDGKWNYYNSWGLSFTISKIWKK